MVIIWKQSRVKIIPLKDELGKVIPANSNKLILLPGMNEVDDAVWDKLKPFLKGHYEWQFLEEIAEKVEQVQEIEKNGKIEKKTVNKNTKDFNDFSNKKSREAIKECYSIDTLEKWRENESRADIRNLIDKRIDDILNAKDSESIEINKND